MSQLGNLLESLSTGKIELIDLTTSLSAQTPVLRLPEPFVNLIDFSLEQVSAYNAPGPLWKHHNIHTGEHIGTHLDAPIHWFTGKDGRDVAQIPPERLLGPAVVLDVSSESAQNPNFLLEIAHVTAWEEAHGPIPQNAWLLLRTGWDRFAQDQEQFLNADQNGPHTPGFSAECAQWLAEHTPISGVGVETVGIDAGSAGGMEPPFPAHHYLLGHDKYGVTSLQNLDKLPPTGAVIVVAPLPIVGGTGSPSRVFALVAHND
ncbi:cyclase family protein [Paeniglutamicibacter antarcticus]|uniref:Cyclase family protein n=1 Tax=Arthrobacter terrae TaxID=2935737 RepID=A0A931G9B1_9MICC|nr:cyclase family protein [Arthrobacter terrae]MBG0740999.1 cyclase family protein [Arthrobacter terrae]